MLSILLLPLVTRCLEHSPYAITEFISSFIFVFFNDIYLSGFNSVILHYMHDIIKSFRIIDILILIPTQPT